MIVRLKGANRSQTFSQIGWFQFYDSPIKSNQIWLIACVNTWFQFYDSPIKSSAAVYDEAFFVCFNSMIVRLKVCNSPYARTTNKGFNSMIVRLKANPRRPIRKRSRSFQFYDSPIKSKRKNRKLLRPPNQFQFYDSPIKRLDNSLKVQSYLTRFNSMIVRLKE